MMLLVRNFNPHINSKTGAALPEGQTRGTKEWVEFDAILCGCLRALGHEVVTQRENPREPDIFGTFDKRIYVHKTKREIPQGDLFYMQMHLRWLFTMDKNGWGFDHSGLSEFSPNFMDEEESVDYCQKLSDELWSSGISKCEQPENFKTFGVPDIPFILVPIQIPRDYTIIHHSPVTVKYFIDSLQAWAEETRNHICFKMHPFNRGDHELHNAVDDGISDNKFVHKVEGNIHELIKRSSGVFAINSGVGFEALIHGKPVATFGNCDYNKVTFNADIRRIDEARNFIYGYPDEYRRIAYKFVWWYATHLGFDVRDKLVSEKLERYLKGAL